MLNSRHLHLEVEVAKWLALIGLAAAIALGLASPAGGSEDKPASTEPALLSAELRLAAQPLPDRVAPQTLPYATSVDVWVALQRHQAGDNLGALEVWSTVQLGPEVDVWRHIAIAAAYLRQGVPELAEASLATARESDANNPVVHYYAGILRLTQARTAEPWYDVTVRPTVRFASLGGPLTPIVPNSRAMYELVAMHELQRAIDNSKRLDPESALTPMEWQSLSDTEMPVVPPTVGDLLAALGAENFVGNSHNMLGYLWLDRGNCPTAEGHWDAAAKTGLKIVYGYRDLGAQYEANGQHGDAARAYLKATAQGAGVVGPGHKAIQNLLRIFRG